MNFIYFYRYLKKNESNGHHFICVTNILIKISLNVSKRILFDEVTQATSDNSTENVHTDLFSFCDLKILRSLSWCLVWWMNCALSVKTGCNCEFHSNKFKNPCLYVGKESISLFGTQFSLYQVPPECQIMQLQPPNVYFLISVPNTTPRATNNPQCAKYHMLGHHTVCQIMRP